METKSPDHSILERAKQALLDGDIKYARFLYKEALSIDPQDIKARSELHRLRGIESARNSFINTLKFFLYFVKLAILKGVSNYDAAIIEAENLLDTNPSSMFALKNILHLADTLKYYKLAIFVSDKIRESGCEIGDLIIIAKAYLNEKVFDKAAKAAKEATEIDPENEEAKDLLWKASVEKHMNSDVSLVTAGSGQRFIPPKIDTDKIFIASHKDAKENKKNSDKIVTP